jgi:hypothetical protein
VHDSISVNELGHRRLAHFHYRALLVLGKMVTGLPQLRVEHDGICKDSVVGTNARGSFLAVKVDPRGSCAFRFVWAYDSCFLEWI